jgi:hypothetical protein
MLIALLACSGDTLPTRQLAGSADYSATLGEEPDFSRPHSLLQARWWSAYAQSSIEGSFADAAPMRYHVESQVQGSCRVVTYEPSFCDPDCGADAECVDGSCVAWPERRDEGVVTWSEPAGEHELQPDGTLGYYLALDTFAAGETSVAFADRLLEAPTIETMEPEGEWFELDEGGGDGVVRWRNPIQDARVRLNLVDCATTHGGLAAAEIECEGPDTGELVVPQAFLEILAEGDWSHGECGSHDFERYHAAGDATLRYESVAPSSLSWWPGGGW